MILRPKISGGNTCTSAGRVTAQLLSFLTFAPSVVHAAGNSRSNEQAVLPIQPDFFNPSPEPPPPAEHVFVSLLPSLPLAYQRPSWGSSTDSYRIASTVITPYPPPRHI